MYSVVNNNGECATTGVSKALAEAEAERLNELFPDEEWEAIEDD